MVAESSSSSSSSKSAAAASATGAGAGPSIVRLDQHDQHDRDGNCHDDDDDAGESGSSGTDGAAAAPVPSSSRTTGGGAAHRSLAAGLLALGTTVAAAVLGLALLRSSSVGSSTQEVVVGDDDHRRGLGLGLGLGQQQRATVLDQGERVLKRKTHAEALEEHVTLTPEDAKKLLDFAIMGFPKTGTSFMEHYLFNQANTPETHLDNREHCLGRDHDFAALENLVNTYGFKLNDRMDDGTPIKNAIKCPHELYGPYNLANYERYLPDIKFIVSTRHPVWWFQSYYNFKLRQRNKQTKGTEIWNPPTHELIGPCAAGAYHYGGKNKQEYHDKHNVCSDGAKFHHALSRFGKTPMDTPAELDLLNHHEMSIHSFPRGKIFLMELGQFKVDDQELADTFLLDLKDFVGLEHDLPPLYQHVSKPEREAVADYYINICDEEHAMVRGELVKTGREAYEWIRDYFIKSPDVIVSSPTHFLDLVERWQFDPCVGEEEI